MRDEVEITEYFNAALAQYLGYPCLSCTVSGADATWRFLIKEFDAEFVQQDRENPETSVLLLGFIKAQNEIASFRNQARRSLDGQWRSAKYSRGER